MSQNASCALLLLSGMLFSFAGNAAEAEEQLHGLFNYSKKEENVRGV